MPFVDVIVPGPWWNALTYISDERIAEGARVRVPIRGGLRVGFAVRTSSELPATVKKIQKITEIIDASCVLGDELWALSRRLGSSFLCGRGEVLKMMSPAMLLKGETSPPYPLPMNGEGEVSQTFTESHCYSPLDYERWDFYLSKLENLPCHGTALVLFSERESAENFFAQLPEGLQSSSLLWTGARIRGKSLWENWLAVRAGEWRVVIGSQAATYVPLPRLSLVIVNDEASPAYIPIRHPRIPVRSAAGQRALIARAELLLGGRMPGAKTYLRKKIPCEKKPDRSLVRFVDIKKGFDAAVQGVEGTLPLSKILVAETQKCLSDGRTALWIFDRKGYSVDITCDSCGNGLKCGKCGAPLLSMNENSLRCTRCGMAAQMPDKCPSCRVGLFVGKRPGIEALEGIAKGFKGHGKLIVGTRKLLSACDKKNVGLVGWIDADAEARKPEYNARFQTFSMVWESYWRGRSDGDNRQVVIQTRNPALHEGLKSGWENFWERELTERSELGFPPCELLVEVKTPKSEKESFASFLEEKNFVVMRPESGAIWVSGGLADLEKALAPRFSISKSRGGFPCVTIFVE